MDPSQFRNSSSTRSGANNRAPNFIKIDAEYSETWGSSFWITSHTVASAYPEENPTEEEKGHFRQFFDTFEHILPCKKCREFWKLVLEERPLTDAVLTNRISLSRWVLDVHNMVNVHLDKKRVFTWKQLVSRYQGIEPVTGFQTKKIITLSPHSVSGTDIIPDKSLGTINMKTPSAWRNSMRNVNEPPKKAVQRVQMVSVPVSTSSRKKRNCGCSGKSS